MKSSKTEVIEEADCLIITLSCGDQVVLEPSMEVWGTFERRLSLHQAITELSNQFGWIEFYDLVAAPHGTMQRAKIRVFARGVDSMMLINKAGASSVLQIAEAAEA